MWWPLLVVAFSVFGYGVQSLWWRGGDNVFEHLPLLWTLSYFQYLPFFLAGFVFAKVFSSLHDWATVSLTRLILLLISWSALFYLYVTSAMDRKEFYFLTTEVTLVYYAVAFQTTITLIALFIRYVNIPVKGSAYIVDASYTVYLIHHLLIFVVALLLSLTTMPSVLKFCLIILTVTAVSLAFHHLLVRRFWVLKFAFNGRYR